MAETSFGGELIRAARTHIGEAVINHQEFAGDCLRFPSPKCFENGLGTDAYDCAGYIDQFIADVMGVEVIEVAKVARHVRDMWRQALESDGAFAFAPLEPGNLLVTERQYRVGDQIRTFAGHIAIITDVSEDKITRIHTSALSGRIQETVYSYQFPIKGCLRYVPLN